MQLAPYLVLVVPPALVGIYAFASTLAGLARLRRLADQEPVLARWPRVTVVSPACNEARHVEAAVRSTLALDYPELALVAVNDRSTDRTGEILDRLAVEDPRLVVVHVRELPDGWLGKLNALQAGVERGDGEWLLFMDADVHLAPDALRRAIADAERHGLDLLTVVPTIESAGRLAGAIFGLSLAILSAGGRLTRVSDPRSPAVAATGAFILVRRAALARTPGFAWLKLEVADDFGLCLLIKSHGGDATSSTAPARCDSSGTRASARCAWRCRRTCSRSWDGSRSCAWPGSRSSSPGSGSRRPRSSRRSRPGLAPSRCSGSPAWSRAWRSRAASRHALAVERSSRRSRVSG
ncbi:MAG: glycosyltransferase [Deltaproteobacteria bacterium]|nr:glycosyltransferase [Deltaproteobacteria bacterium]